MIMIASPSVSAQLANEYCNMPMQTDEWKKKFILYQK